MSRDEGVTVPHQHGVTFYDHDGEAIGAIARYVADGLSAGERVIVIATGWHVAVLDDLLRLRRLDPARERSEGGYLTLDAARTLALFMVDGCPDRALFRQHIGAIVDAAGRDGTTVRAFGEMVALLWDDGNVAAALELEALWNELAKTHEYALLCAYPTQALDSASLGDVSSVCGLHSNVDPPLRYTAMTNWSSSRDDGRQSEVFLPVTASVGAARNYVAGVIERWGEDQLFWDATLITSELATNAVGARSPFRVRMDRGGGIVRIAVDDVAQGDPERRVPASDDTHGRGLPIIERLSRRWGCDRAGEGKVVWAELRASAD